MPRVLWSRRRARATDSPRPAGRRWTGRLRRGGMLVRPVRLVRGVRRRRATTGAVAAHPTDRLASADRLAVMGGEAARTIPSVAPAPHPVVVPGFPAGSALLPGEHTVARRVGFLLVNLCTLASLGLGLLAILLALRGDPRIAAACLVTCVVLDGLDGHLARRLAVSSPFGAQLDSLADMCSFGVAAPVVLFASLAGDVPTPAAAVACALVAAGAAVRLARFNVSPHDGTFFHGVPTTMAAAVLAVAVLIDLPLPAGGQLVGLAVLAFAMVSSFPYLKLGRVAQIPAWLWLVPLAGALFDLQLTFVLLVTAYLLSGPVLWLHHHRRPS